MVFKNKKFIIGLIGIFVRLRPQDRLVPAIRRRAESHAVVDRVAVQLGMSQGRNDMGRQIPDPVDPFRPVPHGEIDAVNGEIRAVIAEDRLAALQLHRQHAVRALRFHAQRAEDSFGGNQRTIGRTFESAGHDLAVDHDGIFWNGAGFRRHEGRILGYTILQHAETPGLGAKADKWFQKDGKGSVIGKNPGTDNLTVKKDGGDIDAITASTITSRAFLLAVNQAYQAYKSLPVDASTGATAGHKK